MDLKDRIANRKAKEIYDLLRKQGTVSKLELLEQSKLSVSTLTRILEELVADKLLLEVGFGESTGGRRPILYCTNEAYAYVFGLDISRIYSKLILFDMHLNKLESEVWMMTENMTPDRLISEISRAVDEMLAKRSIAKHTVLGLGVGAVGPIDRIQGKILNPQYFPALGWHRVPICADLEAATGIPTLLDNGANTAVLGEYWADRIHEYQHLLYVHIGVGLRSAMMSNGNVLYGAVDMEGAVGQMIIQTDGLPYRESRGNYGCLETYASIYALEQAVQSRLKQGRSCVLNEWGYKPDKVTFSALVRALKANDPLIVELFNQAATYFGIGLANLLNTLHPEKVVLGGALVTSHDLFFNVATKVAIKNTYYYPTYQVVFSKGKLGEDALATGAAVIVLNQLTE